MSAGAQWRNGAPNRLREFFEANPSEELSIDDIASKLSVTKETARAAVERMCGTGHLEFVRVVRLSHRARKELERGVAL